MHQNQTHHSQVVADIAIALSAGTSVEAAMHSIRQALRVTDLEHRQMLDERDVHELLATIAMEGGALQSIAEQIAVDGLPHSAPETPTAA